MKATRLALRNFFFLTLLAATALAAPSSDLERALQLYQHTKYDEALRLLKASQDKGPRTYYLIGKSYYMLEEFGKAGDALEKAVEGDPRNSDYAYWLGRAFGRRAETAFFLSAPTYATRARENFERAVELNPRNLDALSDLFKYYLEAPEFLGGGEEKAVALSERIRALNLAKYHQMQARIAEKRKNFQAAEEHLRKAAELAPSKTGSLLNLASFFAERGRFQDSEKAFEQAEMLAPGSPKIQFERAKVYVQSGRNMEVARRLLEQYLKAPLTSDDPPRSEARLLLKKASGN